MINGQFGYAARISAGFVALVATSTLALRVLVSVSETGSLGQSLSYLSHFFTILTNVLVVGVMVAVVLGAWIGPHLSMAMTIAVVGAGIVYYVVLAHLLDLSGLRLIADIGLHAIVPALTFGWWLVFGPKTRPSLFAALHWIAWPLTYCAYILLRAFQSGFYPYPFIDLSEIGGVALARNVIALGFVFAVIGLLLSLVSALLRWCAGQLQI